MIATGVAEGTSRTFRIPAVVRDRVQRRRQFVGELGKFVGLLNGPVLTGEIRIGVLTRTGVVSGQRVVVSAIVVCWLELNYKILNQLFAFSSSSKKKKKRKKL